MKNYLYIVCGIFLFLSACAQAAPSEYSLNPNPADFTQGVDNLYYPLVPGTRWVYQATLADGSTERDEVEVLNETKQIMGVEAIIVHDSVFAEEQLIEDTYDWYAQDTQGNVWYLGEDVSNYENGTLVDHSGSWEWGKDGALPGVIMWADPAAHLNEVYFQEYLQGQAEDQGQVLSVGESVTVPFASYENVVQTYDFSPLEPDVKSHKFYAAGIGTIKEIEMGIGEEVVLIDFIPGDN